MSRIKMFLKELNQESEITRKMLSRVPADQFAWQPHPKSMTLKMLATHIAELPSWFTLALLTDELDFSKEPYKPQELKTTDELLAHFEKSLADGRSHLTEDYDKELDKTWTLRNGAQILSESSKAEVLRMTLNQIVHHRAQLGVYLRLLNIPIPGSYGPSADEV